MTLPSLATSHAKTRKRDRFYGVAYSVCAPWLPMDMQLPDGNSGAVEIDMTHMIQGWCCFRSEPSQDPPLVNFGLASVRQEKRPGIVKLEPRVDKKKLEPRVDNKKLEPRVDNKKLEPSTKKIDLNEPQERAMALAYFDALQKKNRLAFIRPTNRPSSQINLDGIVVPDNYRGPSFHKNNLSEQLFRKVIKYVKKPGNLLHPKYIQSIALEFLKAVKPLENVVHVNNDTDDSVTTVVGDLHGQYDDLMTIFKLNGYPSAINKYIFNGDFVDRGEMSVEVVLTLYLAKLIWPKSVFLNRGNHETRQLSSTFGFKAEMNGKYDDNMYELFCETFESLPLAHIINDDVFVVHGGIPSGEQAVSIDAINKVDRDSEPGESSILGDMLWADPKASYGFESSCRGPAQNFGPDQTDKFLRKNKLTRLVRSHQVVKDGCKFQHNDKTITVFSASNYCGRMENLGAILRFRGTGKSLEPEVIRYIANP